MAKSTRGYRIYLCGGDETPGPRGTDCPSELHNWPLPEGYVDAGVVAGSRLSRGWNNTKCNRCKQYGWRPGRIKPETGIERKVAS